MRGEQEKQSYERCRDDNYPRPSIDCLFNPAVDAHPTNTYVQYSRRARACAAQHKCATQTNTPTQITINGSFGGKSYLRFSLKLSSTRTPSPVLALMTSRAERESIAFLVWVRPHLPRDTEAVEIEPELLLPFAFTAPFNVGAQTLEDGYTILHD